MFPMAINETCPTLLREQKETTQSWELDESFLVDHFPPGVQVYNSYQAELYR